MNDVFDNWGLYVGHRSDYRNRWLSYWMTFSCFPNLNFAASNSFARSKNLLLSTDLSFLMIIVLFPLETLLLVSLVLMSLFSKKWSVSLLNELRCSNPLKSKFGILSLSRKLLLPLLTPDVAVCALVEHLFDSWIYLFSLEI